ncbi:MAG: DUF4190 domain-containing protein [Bacteroidota bacterium]
MKIFFLFLFAVGLSLLYSCATTNDVITDNFISKRKYTRGYFVQMPIKQKKQDVKFVAEKSENKNKYVSFDEMGEEIIVSANNNEPAIIIQKPQTLLVPEKKIISAVQSIKQLYESDINDIKTFRNEYKKIKKIFRNTSAHSDNDKKDEKGTAGLSIASFAFSIVGLIIAGIILGAVAIIFGTIALTKKNTKAKGLAIAGIIIGAADIILVLVYLSTL